jgi:oxygen-independent coproporphyrinogen III oxidase
MRFPLFFANPNPMTHATQLADHGLFDARVPRYTSYPTAPHFQPQVGAGEFAAWVRAIAPGSEVSLYLHVPFCRRLCWFCACRTQGTTSDAPVLAYAKTLRAELNMLARILPPGLRLSRLHWGGGTPTLMPPDLIRDLGQAIFDVLPLAQGGEFSVEIDPNEIDLPRLTALADLGMNRASIGVQDFDPAVQAAIGRTQPFYLTRQVADMIRGAGISALNVDILYGLPHQTPARMTESVLQLVSLAPSRVALYGYAHVPWMSRRQTMIPSDAMPTPQERLHLFEIAADLLVGAGYAPIGIDHFGQADDGLTRAAQAGQLRRNFQGYTDDRAQVLIGVGASSISRFPQGYVQNAPRTADHAKAIAQGQFSAHRGHAFSPDDLLRGAMIEQLMCEFRIDPAVIASRLGHRPAALEPLLQQLARAFGDVVTLDGTCLTIPPPARPLTRLIARALDAYDSGPGQHSAAI